MNNKIHLSAGILLLSVLLLNATNHGLGSTDVNLAGSDNLVYLLDISYRGGEFSLSEIILKSGHVPDRKSNKGNYKLEMVSNSGEILYSLNFGIPQAISVIPSKEELGIHESVPVDKSNLAFIVPYYEDLAGVRIYNNDVLLFDEGIQEGSIRASTIHESADTCITMNSSGSSASKMDIVFVGDNYTSGQLDTFLSDAEYFRDTLMDMGPFNSSWDRFNFYLVNESTDLGCYYNCSGIQRLLCCNDTLVTSAASACPNEEIMVIVNNEEYGGSGGYDYVVANRVYPYVMVHEFGHGIGGWGDGAADEYSYGTSGTIQQLIDTYGVSAENCADVYSGNASEPCPKWSTVEGVGCYSICSYTNLYKPLEYGCMMNDLTAEFCPVCENYLSNFLETNYPIGTTTTTSTTTSSTTTSTTSSTTSTSTTTSSSSTSTTTSTTSSTTSTTTTTSTSSTTSSTTTTISGECLKGDTNCDGTVSDFELLNYIDLWVNGQVDDFDLLKAIDNWVG